MANKIPIFQKNTKTFTCTSPISAIGYIPYFTVKKVTTDPSTLIDRTGTVTDSSTLFFCVSSSDSSLSCGDYVYDITLEKDASIFTIVKDVFSVLDAVRN